MQSSVFAANLDLIETKVVEKATRRQQGIVEETKTPSKTETHTQTIVQESEKEIHWSMFNGAISLKTVNGQLYLSLF